ncbi:MAG: hydrogenase 4 subunit B [Burkholderiales bacterium]|nr:hydrogenase 4 subunit B [Burkholderiales bacterium]
MNGLAIDLIVFAAIFWIALGLVGLAARNNPVFVRWVIFPLGALVGALVAVSAFLADAPETAISPLGLPDLPFHLRLDSLSSFFLLILGSATVGISIFSAGYFRNEEKHLGTICLQYHVFLAAMTFVLLADDAFLFMVSWEAMALSSYFLVTTDHKIPEIRSAGFLYLLMAHVGAISILLYFGTMGGDHSFDAMRKTHLSDVQATFAFLLAVFGFGAKAGILPLHVWLPEAHPAAPSPVSALMSGVMLKTAVYGLLRVVFDLLHMELWWWGVLILAIGLATALFGAIFSAVQSDMKRLLAYSSVENIGIIFVGLGLAVIFKAYSMNALAALALVATLYHCLNHAFFKSLLFLCTGSVLHATGERNLGKLGGLIHKMPWVAWTALVGALAIAGIPPLNGFVSEWLLLQAFLFTPGLPHSYLNMLIPVAAAALVLTGAAAGYVMVKFYGIVFLGQPREETLHGAHSTGKWERAGLLWLALGCVFLGLAPFFVIRHLAEVSMLLVGANISPDKAGWLFLAPISPERASYSPLLFMVVTLCAIGLAFLAVRRFYHGRMRRGSPWNCGYPIRTSRMQDTSEGFGQPIRQIFEPFFRIGRELPSPFDSAPRYSAKTEDRFWYWIYLPFARAVEYMAGIFGKIQQGRILVYLLYNFVTLIALLMFVQ